MGAALGLDLRPGDVVVSLGTSGTAFAVSTHPGARRERLRRRVRRRDRPLPAAGVHAQRGPRPDARPPTCSASTSTASPNWPCRPSRDPAGSRCCPTSTASARPNLPDARGSLHGMTRANLTPPNLARAAIEGMFGGLADAVDALVGVGCRAAADPAGRRCRSEPRGRCRRGHDVRRARSSCRRRASTWPTVPRARRRGCCRVRPRRPRGRVRATATTVVLRARRRCPRCARPTRPRGRRCTRPEHGRDMQSAA